MMKKLFLLVLFCLPMLLLGQTKGPSNGSCFIVGGGHLDTTITNTFLREAGGYESRLIVIPTATATDPEKRDPGYKNLSATIRQWGFQNFRVMHATSRAEADSEEFASAIGAADAIWFTGGRQWRLVDAYAGTKSMEAFRKVLSRGGIIGGSSAGATIQGSYLARGDSKTNTIMMGDHVKGFGFITNIAIDQHVLRRNRQFDLFEILQAHPELLGIGLDENTGLLIKGTDATVIGASYVLVYDGTVWDDTSQSFVPIPLDDQQFYVLRHGDRYDLDSRSIIKE